MQHPVNIVSRHQSPSILSSDDGTRVFVGSPDPLGSQDHLLRSEPESYTTLSRTPLSAGPISRRRTHAPNSSPSTPGSRSRAARNPEAQWTLFGQMMEDGGHLALSPGSMQSRNLQESAGSDYFNQRRSSFTNLLSASINSNAPQEELHNGASSLRHSTHINHDASASNAEYDSDIHSMSSEGSSQTSTPPPAQPWLAWQSIRHPTLSLVSRNVLKCAIAYFIASLFTFSPYFSRLIVDMTSYDPGSTPTSSPSGHMVATMCVAF